ncbi:hypothetical protein Q0M94_25000 (plasmid) [Deinococcus radiomollis]|uniref:beta strand repeat-containing protein n=1 Tax=Deinococcus radiomollis TaxID=468916 RepID=UPI0038924EE3
MKPRYKLLALMVAMSVGSASAASAGTTAGTSITNQATADFIDPTTGAAVGTKPVSNIVTATVLPVTGFDIVYKGPATTLDDGTVTSAAAGNTNDGTTASNPNSNYSPKAVLPGSNVDTTYTVVNNSNIDANSNNTGGATGYVINLTADTTGTGGTGQPLTPGTVKYFLATDLTTPITSVTVPVNGQVDIVQRIVIPATAAVGASYAASPHGVAPAGNVGGNAFSAVDEATNINSPLTAPLNNDLEFTKATIFTPTVVNFPTPPTVPATPTTPSTPSTTVVTPPTANPGTNGGGTPTNPVSPPGTPTLGSPGDPTNPGSPDPLQPSIAIAVSGNSQVAYPPADGTNVAHIVNFSNVVATPVNAGTPADAHLSLFPTDATGAPIGTNNNGVFTVPAIGINPPYTVSFTDTSGNPLPTWTNPADGKVYPYVAIPAGGGNAPYRTVVSYPAPNPNNNTTTPDNPKAVVVLVGVDSSNDSDNLANGTTTDTIYPAAAMFGDVPASGTVADRSLIGSGNVAQVVVPTAAAATGAPNATTITDSTAVFPMIIDNNGQYNDTYTLSGSVPIKNKSGTTTYVAVRYVDASGNPLPLGAGTTNLTNTDGTTTTVPTYVTNLVTAGNNLTVYAIVDVPSTAAATTGTTGINPNPVLTQQAVGNYSTITLTDVNDQIKVNYTGLVIIDKYQAAGTTDPGYPAATPANKNAVTAKPKDFLNYTIVAKNTYNSSVFNFKLSDPATNNIFITSTFQAAQVVLSGFTGQTPALTSSKPYYSIDGGTTWVASTGTGPYTLALTPTDIATLNSTVTGTSKGLLIAVDTDNNGAITAADSVPAGATIELDIKTKVN